MKDSFDFDPYADAIPSEDEGDMSPWMLDELDDSAELGTLRQTLLGTDGQYD